MTGPDARPRTSPRDDANPDGGTPIRARVLIADDEEGTLMLIGEMLRYSGFDVVLAHDGLEAMVRAREAPPDIALLDVMMPGMDGREVCRRMAADPLLTRVPVILHSAADERDVDWRGSGADAFLQKPFRVSALPDFVRQHLGVRDAEPPRAHRLTDEEVRALAAEIRQAVRRPRAENPRDSVLSPTRELSPEDESRVEAALLELLEASRDGRQSDAPDPETDDGGRA